MFSRPFTYVDPAYQLCELWRVSSLPWVLWLACLTWRKTWVTPDDFIRSCRVLWPVAPGHHKHTICTSVWTSLELTLLETNLSMIVYQCCYRGGSHDLTDVDRAHLLAVFRKCWINVNGFCLPVLFNSHPRLALGHKVIKVQTSVNLVGGQTVLIWHFSSGLVRGWILSVFYF